MVDVWLPYGSSEIPARIPEERLIHILKPENVDTPLDAAAEAKRIFESNRSLLDTAGKANRVCIALGASRSRQILTNLTLTLVQTLTELGATQNEIVILETPDSPELDRNVFAGFEMIRHTSASSPRVRPEAFRTDFSANLNSIFTQAGLKILLGEVRPHHFLGVSGLCDIVCPGLTFESSTKASLSGKLQGASDIYRDRVEIAKSLKVLALGFVLDGELEPAKLSFGEITQCLAELRETSERLSTRKVEKAADIVVMSAGGSPIDESLLRSVETLPAALAAVKRGGTIIVAAECAKGHGDEDFYEWSAEHKEPRYLEARLRHKFSYSGFKAAFLLRALEAHRIYLVSTIPDHYVENIFGLRAARTVNSALQSVQRSLGSNSTVSAIPDGSVVLPQKLE